MGVAQFEILPLGTLWGVQHARAAAKGQARTKQVVGQMIGDDKLVVEGKEEERRAAEKETPGDRGDKRQTK